VADEVKLEDVADDELGPALGFLAVGSCCFCAASAAAEARSSFFSRSCSITASSLLLLNSSGTSSLFMNPFRFLDLLGK